MGIFDKVKDKVKSILPKRKEPELKNIATRITAPKAASSAPNAPPSCRPS